MKSIYITILSILLLFLSYHSNGQEKMSLQEVLKLVTVHSFSTKAANNKRDLADYNNKFYLSQLKPSLGLFGGLPNYTKTSSAITQPDGNISFQSIQQANSNLGLFASQVISQTGGTIFVNSDIQRFDNLSSSNKQYNGIPIRIGLNQPLFGFNPWKFDKEIEPIKLEEAQRVFNLDMEIALASATSRYFEILIAKENLDIALTNQSVNEKLLAITEERLLLGKVSLDEKLQLEIELNTAKLSVSQSQFQLELSVTNLYTQIGIERPSVSLEFEVPQIADIKKIDIEKLIEEFKSNRPELSTYLRAIKQADRDIAQVKSDFGFQVNLQASIGLAKGAESFEEVYRDPFDEQRFNISLQVPLLDWGKRKSAIAINTVRKKDIQDNYEQQLQEFINEIKNLDLRLKHLKSELKILQEIMTKANERFEISNQRYILGDLDITNLTLAQREKDQTKRNYINSLQIYWETNYRLRLITGYDLVKNQKIKH